MTTSLLLHSLPPLAISTTILLIAGFAAHRGYLDLVGVVAVAATGGFLGDQAFFWLGRLRGKAVLLRWSKL